LVVNVRNLLGDQALLGKNRPAKLIRQQAAQNWTYSTLNCPPQEPPFDNAKPPVLPRRSTSPNITEAKRMEHGMAEGLLGGVLGGEDEKRGRGPGQAGRLPRHSIRGAPTLWLAKSILMWLCRKSTAAAMLQFE